MTVYGERSGGNRLHGCIPINHHNPREANRELENQGGTSDDSKMEDSSA